MKKLFKFFLVLRGLRALRRGHRGPSSRHGHWQPQARSHDHYPFAARRSRLSDALRALFGRRGH